MKREMDKKQISKQKHKPEKQEKMELNYINLTI